MLDNKLKHSLKNLKIGGNVGKYFKFIFGVDNKVMWFILICIVAYGGSLFSEHQNNEKQKSYVPAPAIRAITGDNITITPEDMKVITNKKIDLNNGLIGLVKSYVIKKENNNQPPVDIFKNMSLAQSVLYLNFMQIDMMNFLLTQKSSFLDFSHYAFINNNSTINDLDKIQGFKQYVINGTILSANCNDETCEIIIDNNNPMFNYKILLETSSIKSFQDYYQQKIDNPNILNQPFICQTATSYDNSNHIINFDKCMFSQDFINNYSTNLINSTRLYPRYLDTNVKNATYRALIAYYFIDPKSVCYNGELAYNQIDADKCISEINDSFVNGTLQVGPQVFMRASSELLKTLDIKTQGNKTIWSFDDTGMAQVNVEKTIKPKTPDGEKELLRQLKKLYKPGQVWQQTPAGNPDNYNKDLIYQADQGYRDAIDAKNQRESAEKLK